ncbi:MAG: ATP-dependent RecD-like DNA helicase [Clostridiales bacterium]|nr:ATP-dependent RecD-like DNA helicase [Clostridiales bacterium]
MSDVLEGYIEKIIFRNDENGYTVLNLICDDSEMTCVGTFPFISEGEYLSARGSFTNHQTYGEQFQVEQYEIKEPEDIIAVEKYLSSGAIKGIGEVLAKRIVAKFKANTLTIMETQPERLAEIKGISDRMARDIGRQFYEKRELRDAVLFLSQYGISNTYAVKIYETYGPKKYQEIVKSNPYQIAEDIPGIGFKTADEIAAKVGILYNSDFRIQAGILYVLQRASTDGHVYLPKDILLNKTSNILGVETTSIEVNLSSLEILKKIIINTSCKEEQVFLAVNFYIEQNIAQMLSKLNIGYSLDIEKIAERISKIEASLDIQYDDLQKQAVMESAQNGLLILTGGPGTGKTTTINAIIRFFESEDMDVLLAAPTGRAAKRMEETTGHEAKTIHRLLEINRISGDLEGEKVVFDRNEHNPLECDVLIIDEMSMVDIHILNSLLKAVSIGTRLILVGDVNQLPSVGPGNVLKDIINSKRFPVLKLTKIYRQSYESDIIQNAHKINAGQKIKLDNKSKDFFLLRRSNVNIILAIMVSLVKDKIPRYINATSFDVQVLTPMRKGELGVENLNKVLQAYLNPENRKKKEIQFRNQIFREGDKVMQIRNNYQLDWEIQSSFGTMIEKGTGVFNGDMGIIKEINEFSEIVTVEFDDGKVVEYPNNQLDELDLAYAITIHKSQGSEYPAVIIPLLSGPRLLMNRNLLYTAVTRARNCVIIIGKEETVQDMIDNASEQRRYTGLKERINGLNK